jgi:hypothetical protein
MSTGDGESGSAAGAVLNRHEEHRRSGIPTVSVLVGPVASGVHSVQRWAKALGRPMVLLRCEQPDPEAVVVPWIDQLTEKENLAGAAVDWLARRLDRPTGALKRSLRSMTPHEVGIFLESVLPLVSEAGVELVSRRLIERAAAREGRRGSGYASAINSLLEGQGRPWIRVFKAMGELVRQEGLPILVLTPAGQGVPQLESVARLLAELAVAQPRAALILLVETGLFDGYVARASVSRAKALLMGSVVNLTCPDPLPPADPVATLAESRECKSCKSPVAASCDPTSEDLESGIWDRESPDGESDDDPARSAAERFLFERLESVPETAGLFELNRALDFCFGPNRWVEVDLAARSLNLVVEIDGYHHFQDPEAFRRDRRKDLELQKHGYLVARVLASDVVERLEDVMDTILKVVAFRRATLDRP